MSKPERDRFTLNERLVAAGAIALGISLILTALIAELGGETPVGIWCTMAAFAFGVAGATAWLMAAQRWLRLNYEGDKKN